MSKSDVRKELLSIRNTLANKYALSEAINLKVINLINAIGKKPHRVDSQSTHSQCDGDFVCQLKIASFLPLPNEINTSLINSVFEVYLPIVHPTLKHGLWFVKDNKNYYKNKYKINEPIYKPTDVIAPWELDIIIVPIVGFTETKYRMGMGGGFYDYSLKFKKHHKEPITIGVAFDEQQNNGIIIDSYDIQLDTIITPTRTL
jgi:5-formyltetrahydrofolate cyclo-ligase